MTSRPSIVRSCTQPSNWASPTLNWLHSSTAPRNRSGARRIELGVLPTYKTVDTCAAEFEASTPYYYSTYEEEDEVAPSERPKVLILGSGPNRIGQGIEFDYCCVHAAFALGEAGFETIMLNCNPETVSTDYDTSDRLYFEPLTFEDVMNVVEKEKPIGVIVQLGGQTPLKLAGPLAKAGVPILGTSPDAIDRAEDRERFGELLADLALASTSERDGPVDRRGARCCRLDRLPGACEAVVRPWGPGDGDRVRGGDARPVHGDRGPGFSDAPGARR